MESRSQPVPALAATAVQPLPGPFAPLGRLLAQRELVATLTRRKLVSRYRAARLGSLWALATPALTLAIYTLVFGVLFGARFPAVGDAREGTTAEYALLLYLGLCVYWFVSESIGESPSLVVDHVNYVKKVVFPLESLAWVVVAHGVVQSLFRFAVFALAYVWLRGVPPATIVWLPLVWLPLCLGTLGLCWVLAAVGVFFRDLREGTGLLLTALLFLSPVFYSAEALPDAHRWLLQLNPLTVSIEQTRAVAFYGHAPDAATLGLALLVSLALAWAGLAVFLRARRSFADVL